MNLRVGSLVLDAGIGGHARSAITIARSLTAQGVQVTLYLPHDKRFLIPHNHPGLDVEAIDSRISNKIYFTPILIYRLYKQLKQRNVAVLHSFDLLSHIVAYFLSRLLHIPTVGTICGGTVRHHYPYARPAIVFSRELKDLLTHRLGFKPDEIIVEPARIETDHLPESMDRTQLIRMLDIDSNKHLIVMICRFSRMKEKSLIYALQAIEQLAKRRDDFVFLLLGGVNSTVVKNKIDKLIHQINHAYQRTVALTNESLAAHAVQVIGPADIVLGVGRVCFEAMLYGKPALVVGEAGYAGMISPVCSEEQMQDIIYYNFSGRNVREAEHSEKRKAEMVHTLNRLLSDNHCRIQWGKFANAWLTQNMDVKIAAAIYSQVYLNLISKKSQKIDNFLYPLWGYIILAGGRMKDFLRELCVRKTENNTPNVRKIMLFS